MLCQVNNECEIFFGTRKYFLFLDCVHIYLLLLVASNDLDVLPCFACILQLQLPNPSPTCHVSTCLYITLSSTRHAVFMSPRVVSRFFASTILLPSRAHDTATHFHCKYFFHPYKYFYPHIPQISTYLPFRFERSSG